MFVEFLTRIGFNKLFPIQRKETWKIGNSILLALNDWVCHAHRPNEFLDGNSKKQR